MTTATSIEVLIVGAGPTGLMLAAQLARRGVRVLIVEKNPGPSVQTKALAVQARTLEIYSRLGTVREALELGQPAVGATVWTGGQRVARVPLGDIGRDLSPFPFVLILGQDDNEKLLAEKLREHGVEVQWNTELVGLVQTSEHVIATLRRQDGSTTQITANWVGGCDGPHSAVRDLCGIAFPGAPYEHVFFVADTHATGPMVAGELNGYLWENGFHIFFPMRGTNHWRVVGILPPQLRAREDLSFDDVVSSVREQVGSELAFEKCTWFSTYRIHHRRAERFRDRRCFLLGDAAHIHSPVGGQGMNTGLQDAYNLAWKLALVTKGQAGEGLLDSYQSERVPVAARLLHTTDQAFSVVVSDRWVAGFVRTRLAPKLIAFALRFAELRKLAFRTISQIGISYPASSLSQTQENLAAGAPLAGERFPWLRLQFSQNGPVEDLFEAIDDTRFTLLLFGQPPPAGGLGPHDDLVRIHCVPENGTNEAELARARIPQPSYFLLRPDGHVGLAGARLEAAAPVRYLTERARLGVGITTAPCKSAGQ